MLTTGTYWFWNWETVYKYDITVPFYPPVELNVLLQDEELASLLYVIEVRDNEIVLQFEKRVAKAGIDSWQVYILEKPGKV